MTTRARFDLYIDSPGMGPIHAADCVVEEEAGLVRRVDFRYTPDYLGQRTAFPLDPRRLPLESGEIRFACQGGVPGFIDDHLPDAWGRKVLTTLALYRDSRRLNVNSVIDLATLAPGGSSIGALSLTPRGQPPSFTLGAPIALLEHAERAVVHVDAMIPETDADEFGLVAMHRDRRIELPPPKWTRNRPGPIVFGPDTGQPLIPPPTTLDEVRPVELRTAMRYSREGKLWKEYVARYHYLGLTTLVGAQMPYAVHARDGTPLAMLGFSTAAWKLAPRDRLIGWSPELREKNLPRVVDNPRFLILPWIHIPNLGSHILAIVRRQLPLDWTARYNTTPVLMETFVETPRYTGAVYRASGWTHVGATQGHGRYDTKKRYDKPKKDIWLRPLRKDWKRVLKR